MGDRYNIHNQLEHLQSKYIGTGHADSASYEWMVNQKRDSCSSYLAHFELMNYFALVENEAKARIKFNLSEKMLQPCGSPYERPRDLRHFQPDILPFNFMRDQKTETIAEETISPPVLHL